MKNLFASLRSVLNSFCRSFRIQREPLPPVSGGPPNSDIADDGTYVTFFSGSKVSIDSSGNVSFDGALAGSGVSVITTGSYINTGTGYKVGGGAASGHYLRGNGTYYVDSAIQAADIPNLDASIITSGVFSISRIPTIPVTSIANGVNNWFLVGTSGSNPTYRALVAGDIPSLDASKITTGSFASNLFGNGIVTLQGIQAGGFNVTGGYDGTSGSFTTADGKTVYVQGGIIYSIS